MVQKPRLPSRCCSVSQKQVAPRSLVSRQASTIKHAVDSARHPPVTRLETTSGKISIFSILIRISPGKAMIIMTSGGRGDMCRSSIPVMEPRNTPAWQKKERERRDRWGIKETIVLSIEYDYTTFAGLCQTLQLLDPQINSSENLAVSQCEVQSCLVRIAYSSHTETDHKPN